MCKKGMWVHLPECEKWHVINSDIYLAVKIYFFQSVHLTCEIIFLNLKSQRLFEVKEVLIEFNSIITSKEEFIYNENAWNKLVVECTANDFPLR